MEKFLGLNKLKILFSFLFLQQCITNTEDFEQRIVLLSKKQEADLSVLESQLELARNRQKELQEQLVLLNERFSF